MRNSELLTSLFLLIFFASIPIQVLLAYFYVHPLFALVGYPGICVAIRLWAEWLEFKRICETERLPLPSRREVVKALLKGLFWR